MAQYQKVNYAALKNTEARKECHRSTCGSLLRTPAGSGPANLRFFQAETQNYAWILRSVPMDDVLASRLHTSIAARTPRDSSCGYLPGSEEKTFRSRVISVLVLR